MPGSGRSRQATRSRGAKPFVSGPAASTIPTTKPRPRCVGRRRSRPVVGRGTGARIGFWACIGVCIGVFWVISVVFIQ
jgi:hypothetical protein